MARDFVINGEAMVVVQGGAHLSGGIGNSGGTQLGLAMGPIQITVRTNHTDIYVDDFGPSVPAELMYQLTDARITMDLIHYDKGVLDECLGESMGGLPDNLTGAGFMNTAGTMMGNGLPIFASGNHYVSLNILSPIEKYPYLFPAAYMTGPPLVLPMGTEKTVAKVEWRAIPYTPPYISGGSLSQPGAVLVNGVVYTPIELLSSGVTLWDHGSLGPFL